MVILCQRASAVTKAAFQALTDPRFSNILLMQLQKVGRTNRERKVHAEAERTRKFKGDEYATARPSENSYTEVNVARTFVGLQYKGLVTRAADCF